MEVRLAPVHEVQEDLQVVGAGAIEDDEELGKRAMLEDVKFYLL